MDGWFLVHKQLAEWEWFKTPNMVHLWVYLMIKANHQPSRFQGHAIPRGSLVFGLPQASEDTGISVQSIRTCIDRLKSTGEITRIITSKFSIITICNYEKYQTLKKGKQQPNQQADQQSPNSHSTVNQQHLKEIKEIKEEKEDLARDKHPSPLAPKHLKRFKTELKPRVCSNEPDDPVVWLTDEHWERLGLYENGGDAIRLWAVERAENWAAKKGSTFHDYTDHYKTLTNMILREKKTSTWNHALGAWEENR